MRRRIHLSFRGGIHPDDTGYGVIADQMIEANIPEPPPWVIFAGAGCDVPYDEGRRPHPPSGARRIVISLVTPVLPRRILEVSEQSITL